MANFCKHCIFWKEAFTRYASEVFGLCSSDDANDEIAKEEKDCEEEGALFTQQWFGCVHFRKTDTVLIDINKEIKK